jgi:hypothetical protein
MRVLREKQINQSHDELGTVKSRWMANFTKPETSWMSSLRIRLARQVSTVLGAEFQTGGDFR